MVDLPASGWEMTAMERLRLASMATVEAPGAVASVAEPVPVEPERGCTSVNFSPVSRL